MFGADFHLVTSILSSYSHLTDYLRYLFLFKFGGTCKYCPSRAGAPQAILLTCILPLSDLDMDAPWVRSPPDSRLEFIGADFSTVASDLDWTLDEDGMYLAPGVMRFRKGWTLFREIMESAFSSTYRPDCFNCVGPRAITLGVRARRRQLELAGFTILPNHVLYPKNWITSHELVKTVPGGRREALEGLSRIVDGSWSIHLFGKMTNHLRIQPGSIIGEAFKQFSLDVPRRVGLLSSSDRELGKPDLGRGIELRLPKTYRYRSRVGLVQSETERPELKGSVDGAFDGLDVVFVRGVRRPRVDKAILTVETDGPMSVSLSSSSSARLVATGQTGVTMGSGGGGGGITSSLTGASKWRVELDNCTLKDINAVLNSLRLVAPSEAWTRDVLRIAVVYGDEKAQGQVDIIADV